MVDLEMLVERPEPGVHVTSIGGMPAPLVPAGWSIAACLGESALLTKMNPRRRSRAELGGMCIEQGHLWAGNWIMLGLTFVGYRESVHLAWARDRRFWLSWSEARADIWTATGSVAEWIRYLGHWRSESFEPDVRRAMDHARSALRRLDPYFDGEFSKP